MVEGNDLVLAPVQRAAGLAIDVRFPLDAVDPEALATGAVAVAPAVVAKGGSVADANGIEVTATVASYEAEECVDEAVVAVVAAAAVAEVVVVEGAVAVEGVVVVEAVADFPAVAVVVAAAAVGYLVANRPAADASEESLALDGYETLKQAFLLLFLGACEHQFGHHYGASVNEKQPANGVGRVNFEPPKGSVEDQRGAQIY